MIKDKKVTTIKNSCNNYQNGSNCKVVYVMPFAGVQEAFQKHVKESTKTK